MYFEQNGSCHQKMLLLIYVLQILYNFISILVLGEDKAYDEQNCPEYINVTFIPPSTSPTTPTFPSTYYFLKKFLPL